MPGLVPHSFLGPFKSRIYYAKIIKFSHRALHIRIANISCNWKRGKIKGYEYNN